MAIRSLRRERRFDAAVFSGRRTVPALDALQGLPLVVDMCDATSLRLRGHLRFAAPPRRPVVALDLLLTRHLEGRLQARADHLLFATWRDREVLLGRSASLRDGPPASIVPNGVDVEAWRRTSTELGQGTIVFSGAMDYAPNVDAAVRLGTSILPLVRHEVPEARLLIVGRDPTPEVQALAGRPGVTVTGFVEAVLPYLEQGSVFAAPLRFGAGIQNKLLEALAAGLPTVASPIAAAGLQLAPREPPPVTVARDDAAFAAAIVTRLAAARDDPQPDAAGRDWVAQHFDWQRSGELLRTIVDGLPRAPEAVV
jgi:glycosyltransferase involved in cell wall biosynthesis